MSDPVRLCGQALVNVLMPLQAAPGDYVMVAGEVGMEMFFIDTGQIEIWSGDMKELYRVAQPGEFFGEVSVLTRERRTATCRSVSYSELWSLARGELDKLGVDYPEMKARMEQCAIERLNSQVGDGVSPGHEGGSNTAATMRRALSKIKGARAFGNILSKVRTSSTDTAGNTVSSGSASSLNALLASSLHSSSSDGDTGGNTVGHVGGDGGGAMFPCHNELQVLVHPGDVLPVAAVALSDAASPNPSPEMLHAGRAAATLSGAAQPSLTALAADVSAVKERLAKMEDMMTQSVGMLRTLCSQSGHEEAPLVIAARAALVSQVSKTTPN